MKHKINRVEIFLNKKYGTVQAKKATTKLKSQIEKYINQVKN